MSITELPPEILLLIADQLSQKDKASLSLTSFQLHHMCQQSLYADVTLPENVDNAPHRALFKNLIKKPELARCVRSLAFQYWEHSYTAPRHRSILEPDGDLVSKIVRESSGYTEEEKKKWTVDLRMNSEDAWIALIIPRLTRLRKLNLS